MESKTIEKAFEFYWEGYKQGKGTESHSNLEKETARSQFERYLDRNYE